MDDAICCAKLYEKPIFFYRVPLFFYDRLRFSRDPVSFSWELTGFFRDCYQLSGSGCSAARIAFTVRVRFLSDNIYESKITDMKRKFNHKKIIVGVIVTAYLTMLIGGIITVLSNLDSISYGIFM